jgi:hypothetical protein
VELLQVEAEEKQHLKRAPLRELLEMSSFLGLELCVPDSIGDHGFFDYRNCGIVRCQLGVELAH